MKIKNVPYSSSVHAGRGGNLSELIKLKTIAHTQQYANVAVCSSVAVPIMKAAVMITITVMERE